MNVINFINDNSAYFIMGIVGVLLLFFILFIIQSSKYKKLRNKYNKFMSGSTGESLEKEVLKRFSETDQLKMTTEAMNKEINKMKDNIAITYQKIGVEKYDAFKEMGGKLSFVLALLDKNNNGILLNSVHSSREGCYTYIKEIIKGESFIELSEEEEKALKQAVNSSNFMQ
jgi:hypothetical protein